ncbi:MAG: helix-turn-helix domain-containing protein [Thomasclavelia sp.]
MQNDFNKINGSLLKEARKKQNLTLTEVAKKCGKSVGWLGDIESGRNRIYFDDMKILCSLYNITLDEISLKIDELQEIVDDLKDQEK